MFKRNFANFLNKSIDKKELYPYLYSINFKGLVESRKEIKTQPIKCSQCGAILTDVSTIKEDDKIGTHYQCEFCGTVNVIEKSQIVQALTDDIDFIIQDIVKPEDTQITGVSTTEGELYLAVIDISGSMSGGKIEAVKKSLIQTIKDYKINSPTTKFVLIAFESSIYYYLRHDSEPINFSGDILFKLEMMKAEYEKAMKDPTVGSIGEFADGWIRKVESLRPMDMTALGPALYFGILTFAKVQSTGRLTLLTDGLANQGAGNLSGTSPAAAQFYDDLADLCNSHKIIVDVVGVSAPGDNNEMGFDTLGKITDKTGGSMFIISSSEMEAIFSQLRQTNYIVRDVNVKIVTPNNVSIQNITGAYSSKGEVKESEFNLGAVTGDRELYVELDSSLKGAEEEKEIPVQLQVEYTDNEGRKRLRVVNDKVKLTSDEKKFKAEYDQKVNAMMNIQMAGAEYYSGKADKSKGRLKELKQNIQNEMESLKGAGMSFAEEDYMEGIDYLDDELEEMEMEEIKMQEAPAKSYMAAQGQMRTRLSAKMKKAKMEKKKAKK